MSHRKKSEDRLFKEALSLWDRPEEELHGKCLDADADVDAFLNRAFTSPAAGIFKA